MMKATNISPGAAKSGYYNVEGYYTKDSDEAGDASTWYGKAAKELGLEGKLDPLVFEKMLDGQTYEKGPDGIVEGKLSGRWSNGEREHRPGLDLTFSAPKSVSIAALLFEDKRLIEAHQNAVKATLDVVESELLQTRLQKNGEMVKEGGKMIAGLFIHDTSRALDPQLHTHAALANAVRNSSDEYTALNNDLIMKSVTFGSAVYRKELSQELEKLGYTVEREGPHRLISLKEIPKEFEELYSKRSKQIEEAIEKYGADNTPKNRELAALATRVRKGESIDRDLLRDEWKKEAKEAGLDFENVRKQVQKARDRENVAINPKFGNHVVSDLAREAVNKGIEHLSESATTFSKPQLLEAAVNFGDDRVPLSAVVTELNNALKDKRLFPAATHSAMGKTNIEMYTDEKSLLTEQKILAAFRKGINASRIPRSFGGRAMAGAVHQVLRKTNLTDGQKEAISMSLTGNSLFTGVQGYAGTGKTYALSKLETIANKSGFHVSGLAGSQMATGLLKEAIKDTETLQAFLTRGGPAKAAPSPKKTILILDEASFTSNRQMLDFMKIAQQHRYARVVLVGDEKQLDGVEAGTPFSLLQKMKMPTATMIDIVRQRGDELKSVVYHAIAGEVKEAFAKIGSKVHIAEDKDYARLAADLFLSKDKSTRDKTIIATPSNRVRMAINQHVRQGLKSEREIAESGTVFDTLVPHRMSKVERSEPRSYREGDIVLSHSTIKSAHLKAGNIYEVKMGEDNQLRLMDRETGKVSNFDPSRSRRVVNSISVYSEEKKEFVVGEKVKFNLTDKKYDIKNGDKGSVSAIDEKFVTVQFADKKSVKLNLNSQAAKGMDYAYALTGHGVQGMSIDNVIVALGANEYLADQKGFYVGISRGKESAELVTDNPTRLAERLERQTGEQIPALEAYGRKLDELKLDDEQRSNTSKDQAENEETKAQLQEKEKPSKSDLDEKPLVPEPSSSEIDRKQDKAPEVKSGDTEAQFSKSPAPDVKPIEKEQSENLPDIESLKQRVQELGEQKQRGEFER
jgi:conjugative relaxase-like TrwC/TraI family protein